MNGTPVNGRREDLGDISTSVESDSQLVLTDTVPAGPVALGGNIAYSLSLANTGARDAGGQSFSVNGGPQVGILVANPIPVGTQLLGAPAPAAPGGYTVVYTTSPLATPPSAAVWTSAAPPLASVTRVGYFAAGGTVGAGATAGPFTFSVVITTANASSPIGTIADAFGRNFAAANITDQSGDPVANAGDLNADFTEGAAPGNVDGNGIRPVHPPGPERERLLGPSGAPGAVHNDNNDDFTDLSSTAGNNLPPGSVTGGRRHPGIHQLSPEHRERERHVPDHGSRGARRLHGDRGSRHRRPSSAHGDQRWRIRGHPGALRCHRELHHERHRACRDRPS